MFLNRIALKREAVPSFQEYPFDVPAVRRLQTLKITSPVTFFALVLHRLHGNGLYLFDEPEAVLPPTRQLSLLVAMHQRVKARSQFIIATHSPILLGYPCATIYEFGEHGLRAAAAGSPAHAIGSASAPGGAAGAGAPGGRGPDPAQGRSGIRSAAGAQGGLVARSDRR